MMKSSKRAKSWTTTRVETWATPGIPDIDICDEYGRFHKVELKVTEGNKVELRPHQVSYLTRHKHASVWILVRKGLTKTNYELSLYRGEQAVDVCMDGLKTEPVLRLDTPENWDALWDTIAPIMEHEE